MADVLVSALLQTVIQSLSSKILKEIGLAWGLKDELNNLERIFCAIQLVLHDAELQQKKNKAIENWLMNLKDAAYDAEDILDVVATEGLRRRNDSERGIRHKLINTFILPRNPLIFRFKIANKVKNLRKKLDAINCERHQFHLTEGVMEYGIGVTIEDRMTSSLVNESKIYGRDEEKKTIIKSLLDFVRDCDDLYVYAICGMGGIGKTTLAQQVYNDKKVKASFELRIWVCVSDDFSVQRSVRSIIESIERRQCDLPSLDIMQQYLQEKLIRGKRFLLILDDVWSENPKEWNGLKETLRCGSNESVVIVTTRIEKVAIMMDSISTHQLPQLSDDDAQSLFRQIAFANKERDENLEVFGKEIVRKCGGVPLAVKSLGILMKCKSSEREWLAIRDSEIWQLSDKENGILPALRLSYDNLPLQMRQCFAYCCMFPKDHEMEKDELIQLWLANGFISSDSRANLPLEIFKELSWRSFFQDVKTNWRGKTVCKMHDLMHDLARSVMKHEMFIQEDGKELENQKRLRHLTTSKLRLRTSIMDKSTIGVSLRSLIIDKQEDSDDDDEGISSFLSKQQSLRVLKLNIRLRNRLSRYVFFRLKLLRYLELSCSGIERLPKSVIFLFNLQTLKLIDSDELRKLPKDLKYLKNLRFLDIDNFQSLVSTPPDLGELKFLQRLSIFIVGEASSHQIHQLKELDLEGKLTIQGLENVRNFEDATSANLKSKKNLTDLELSWGFCISSKKNLTDKVLEGLQPHQNLEKLTISNFPGSRLPDGFQNLSSLTYLRISDCEGLLSLSDGFQNLSSLTELNISNCPKLESLPESIQQLSALKTLYLWGCYGLLSLPGFQNLSSLTELHIWDCPKLESLPESIQQLSALKTLWIADCEGLLSLPNGFQNLSSLTIIDCPHLTQRCQKPNGEDWWKIRHIPNIYIN